MNELFSIIIPVHNREKLIKETLRSVVGQEYRPIHLVLVDNNSTDNSIAVAREFLAEYESDNFIVTFAEELRQGACVARNKGVSLTEAQYMMFLDDDDMLSSFRTITSIAEEFGNTNADIVGFTAQLCSGNKRTLRRYSFTNNIKEQILHCMLSTQCFAVKRAFFDITGGWDERIKRWQDWNLGIRMMLHNPKISWIKKPHLVNIRVHKSSITGDGYLHSNKDLEEAVMLTAESVINSGVEEREDISASIYGRMPILAAHYLREGSMKVAKRTISLYQSKVKLSIIKKICIYLLILYTFCGGRGAGRLINCFNIKLK